MIKKITALALCFVMMFSLLIDAKTFSDVPVGNKELTDAVATLSELGIISGMSDTSFAPNEYLTRAQFAKMAVCIMGKTKEAVITTDAFSDVKSTDWYSGYVNVVAQEGVITGYPDGSFGANDALTYAQAITVIVRLLGYNAEDVGHKWPQGYIDKATLLNLLENIDFDRNGSITRSDAAIIIYRALFTDMKESKAKLVTRMGKNVYEDAVVLATRNENASLLVNEVKTTSGVFKYEKDGFDISQYVGCEGTLVVNDLSEVIAFAQNDGFTSKEYTVSAVYKESNSDNVTVIADSGETIVLSEKAKMYTKGDEVTAANLASGVNAGSIITLFNENGSLKYVVLDEYKNEGPVTYTTGKNIEAIFGIDNMGSTKIIRKGISSSLDKIEEYDVLYYSERTNTLYVYCDRVTGMYEKAYPMKANVNKVTLSGKEYSLSTLAAVNKLNESAGAFEIGDRVTLLFGENGEVVDAVSLTASDYSMYGVVTAFGTKVSEEDGKEGREEFFVRVMHTDGNEVDYVVEDDTYEDEIGNMCIVDFENFYAKLKFPSKAAVYGMVDKSTSMIGNYKISSDCKVMEYVKGSGSNAVVSVLNVSDLDKLSLVKSDVKFALLDKKGEVTILYVDNVTGNSGIYGIIIDDPGAKDGKQIREGAYTILSKNTKYTFVGTHTSLRKGDCVAYVDGNTGAYMQELIKIASGEKIENLVDNVITLDGKQYTLSDDAVIYMGASTSEIKTASKDDMVGVSGRVTLFSEKSTRDGGKIRIVRIYN